MEKEPSDLAPAQDNPSSAADAAQDAKTVSTAFTIDFGPSETPKKKLGLKDGIRHFAPFKKNRPKAPDTPPKAPVANGNEQSSPPSVKEPQEGPKYPSGGADAERNNNHVKMASTDNKQAEERHHQQELVVPAEALSEDACSEAGTYTIDNDAEADSDGLSGETPAQKAAERARIALALDVSANGECTTPTASDWVSAWAETTCRTSPSMKTSSPSVGGQSPVSESASGSSRSTRRKLPATPETMKSGGGGPSVESQPMPRTGSSSNTESYLQDTINAMAAMEARMGKRSPATASSSGPSVRPKTATSKASKANQAAAMREERKLAWERRKNYDPLKSSGLQKRGPSSLTNVVDREPPSNGRAAVSSFEESCYSDSCSEVESPLLIQEDHSDIRTPASNSQFMTKPNRAFALRQKLNSAGSDKGKPATKQPSSGSSFNRTPLRSSTGQPTSMGSVPTAGRMAPRALHKKSVGECRSTSSLSSREVEFQAWKRRKNYNPLHSASSTKSSSSVKRGGSSGSSGSAAGVTKGDFLPNYGGQSSGSRARGHSAASASSRGVGGSSGGANSHVWSHRGAGRPPAAVMTDNMQRSASFHYPDGMSRVQRNVYTSEDDSTSEDVEVAAPSSLSYNLTSEGTKSQRTILEVNDDEFILPIESSSCGPQRRRPDLTSPSKSHQSSGSGGSRMEALDNLVISTIFSISAKLCLNSTSLIRRTQERVTNEEHLAIMDTLLYVLEDSDLPTSPSKKTSRELAGTLRNLKKVEQVLQLLERLTLEEDECYEDEDDAEGDVESNDCDRSHRL